MDALVDVVLKSREMDLKTCRQTVNREEYRKRKSKVRSDFQCACCSIRSTPLVRRGPSGLHNYCNACGLAWKKEIKERQQLIKDRE